MKEFRAIYEELRRALSFDVFLIVWPASGEKFFFAEKTLSELSEENLIDKSSWLARSFMQISS
jgi:hypothetical protein